MVNPVRENWVLCFQLGQTGWQLCGARPSPPRELRQWQWLASSRLGEPLRGQGQVGKGKLDTHNRWVTFISCVPHVTKGEEEIRETK